MLAPSLGRAQQREPGSHDWSTRLASGLHARLLQAAQRAQVTLNTLMQGAWAILLARYGGRHRAAFGVTVSGRPADLPGVERMMGLFINSVPLWVDAPASAPATDWLRELHTLNHALRDIPREKIRLHVCWGSAHGPHKHDLPLKDIIDIILTVKASSYSIEASNPAHEHEWRVWQDVALPDGKLLIPGVVSHCRRRSNGVERRLARWRYFGGIALETFERVLGARLHAGALRHEVGVAGGADRRNLLGRRLLGRGRKRSPNHEPGCNQQAHSAPTAELHASLPFCRPARCTIALMPSSMRCIAVARRLCDCGLVC